MYLFGSPLDKEVVADPSTRFFSLNFPAFFFLGTLWDFFLFFPCPFLPAPFRWSFLFLFFGFGLHGDGPSPCGDKESVKKWISYAQADPLLTFTDFRLTSTDFYCLSSDFYWLSTDSLLTFYWLSTWPLLTIYWLLLTFDWLSSDFYWLSADFLL